MTTHLDWHFKVNRREKARQRRATCRNWFLTIDRWIVNTDESVFEIEGAIHYYALRQY